MGYLDQGLNHGSGFSPLKREEVLRPGEQLSRPFSLSFIHQHVLLVVPSDCTLILCPSALLQAAMSTWKVTVVCYVVSCVHTYAYQSLKLPCLDFSTCFWFPPPACKLLVHPCLAQAWPNQYFLIDWKELGRGAISKQTISLPK